MMKPYYEHDGITIYHGDCREILPTLPNVDAVVTDPPYGITGGAFVRRGGAEVVDESKARFNATCAGWRDLVRARTFWVEWCKGPRHVPYKQLPEGWEPWREFVWYKPAPAPTPRPTLMSAFEMAAIAISGKRPWYGGQHPDAWSGLSPNRLGRGLGHPAEKPLACMSRLMAPIGDEDTTTLDPFMGSGTTLRAAKDLGRKAIGIEIEEKYCEIAAERMAQEVLL